MTTTRRPPPVMVFDCQLCGADFTLAPGSTGGAAIELTDGSTLLACADCAAVVEPLVARAERSVRRRHGVA